MLTPRSARAIRSFRSTSSHRVTLEPLLRFQPRSSDNVCNDTDKFFAEMESVHGQFDILTPNGFPHSTRTPNEPALEPYAYGLKCYGIQQIAPRLHGVWSYLPKGSAIPKSLCIKPDSDEYKHHRVLTVSDDDHDLRLSKQDYADACLKFGHESSWKPIIDVNNHPPNVRHLLKTHEVDRNSRWKVLDENSQEKLIGSLIDGYRSFENRSTCASLVAHIIQLYIYDPSLLHPILSLNEHLFSERICNLIDEKFRENKTKIYMYTHSKRDNSDYIIILDVKEMIKRELPAAVIDMSDIVEALNKELHSPDSVQLILPNDAEIRELILNKRMNDACFTAPLPKLYHNEWYQYMIGFRGCERIIDDLNGGQDLNNKMLHTMIETASNIKSLYKTFYDIYRKPDSVKMNDNFNGYIYYKKNPHLLRKICADIKEYGFDENEMQITKREMIKQLSDAFALNEAWNVVQTMTSNSVEIELHEIFSPTQRLQLLHGLLYQFEDISGSIVYHHDIYSNVISDEHYNLALQLDHQLRNQYEILGATGIV